MSVARAYRIEDQLCLHAANDNAAPPARTKLKLRLAAQRRFDSQDQISRRASITDGADSGNGRSYGYDALGRLTSASGPWGSGSASYNVLNNVRTRTLGSRNITINYDTSKNRVNQSVDSLSTGSSGTGTRAVDYDNRGNVTSLGNLAMVYDYSDQPTLITGTADGVGSANGSFLYDGNLKRVRSIVNGKTIYNVYDASGKLVHVHKAAGGNQALERSDYVSAGGKAIARVVHNGTAHYTFSDHLGSPVTTMNATTGDIERERYTPFGIASYDPDVLKDQAGFTGHIKDSATGLNYMQARYYDPVIGRFLSIDPVDFMQTGNPTHFNRYAYCGNNPLNCTDPTGMVGVNLDPFNRPPPTREQVINRIAGTLLAIEVGLIAADVAAFGPTGEGIVPAIGVRAAREGFETAMQRGVRKEADTLADMGLKKNTQKVSSPEGNSIPDALTDTVSVEVKDTKSVCCSKQVRIQTDAAKASGRESVLVTGTKTKVNDNAEAAFDRIIRRDNLGPQE